MPIFGFDTAIFALCIRADRDDDDVVDADADLMINSSGMRYYDSIVNSLGFLALNCFELCKLGALYMFIIA